jgi:RNA polymerase sigma factor (sigma-70 family)
MPRGSGDQDAITATSVELLRLARVGDRRALDELFERLFPPLRQWAHGRLPWWARSFSDTADLVQDALLNTFRRIDTVDVKRKGALQAYLRQAVRNRVRDELRGTARQGSNEPITSSLIDHQPSPLELAMDAKTHARYTAALARLRPNEQELIVGRLDLEYSYDQLALATGRRGAEAARIAVRRALTRLVDEMSA